MARKGKPKKRERKESKTIPIESKEREREESLLQSRTENQEKHAEKLMEKAEKAKVIVIFPTINEESTIKNCIETAMKSKYEPSIIVSDGHSGDKTADVAKSCGATVVKPQVRLHPGKGAAMVAGIEAALKKNPDVVVFLDADIMNLTPEWVNLLVDSITVEGYDMARGWYLRAPSDASVTKLVAKPMLWTFFPELWHYEQPLSGEVAAKAELWEELIKIPNTPKGWGIDVWFLIETAMAGHKIKEVFLGTKSHKSHMSYATDVAKLIKMGEQVGLAVIQEAIKYHRIDNATQTQV